MEDKASQRNRVAMPPNLEVMEPYLQQIQSQLIRIGEKDDVDFNRSLCRVLRDRLVEEMKKDEIFSALFSNIWNVGSYYENLRVKTPNEFDLNLNLQLPEEYSHLKVETENVEPGFAQLRLEKAAEANSNCSDCSNKVIGKVKQWFDKENFLLRGKVYSWLQSVVDSALNSVNWQKLGFKYVKRSTNGPAVTLTIGVHYTNAELSIDLVPVFSFADTSWPAAPVQQIPKDIAGKNLPWFVVPKQPGYEDKGRLWRLSFAAHEREMIAGLNHLKPIIKMLKLLRDEQDWKGLSSYYVKTVCLWEVWNERDNPYFWRRSLSRLFYHMLCRLEERLHNHYIPFFWHPECNLLQHIGEETTTNWGYCVGNIRLSLSYRLNNPEGLQQQLLKVFTHKSSRPLSEKDTERNEVMKECEWLTLLLIQIIMFALSSVQKERMWLQSRSAWNTLEHKQHWEESKYNDEDDCDNDSIKCSMKSYITNYSCHTISDINKIVECVTVA